MPSFRTLGQLKQYVELFLVTLALQFLHTVATGSAPKVGEGTKMTVVDNGALYP